MKLVLTLLAVATLSGCLGETHAAGKTIQDTCRGVKADHCTEDANVLTIDGISTRHGLVIVPKGLEVLVRNVTASGEVGMTVDMRQCTVCRVRLESVAITGEHVGLQVLALDGQKQVGLQVMNAVIKTVGGGTVIANGSGQIASIHRLQHNGTTGIELQSAGSLELGLTNVTLGSQRPSAGLGIGGAANAPVDLSRLELRDVAIDGYRVGVGVNSPSVDVGGLSIACREAGIVIGPPASEARGTFVAEDATVRGCSRHSFWLYPFDDVRMSDVIIQGGPVGMEPGRTVGVGGPVGIEFSAPEFFLDGFAINSTSHGITGGGLLQRVSATLINGSLRNNQFVGARLGADRIEVRNVSFEGNGHGWPDASQVPGLQRAEWYGGLVIAAQTGNYVGTMDEVNQIVSDSEFVNNVPYGLVAQPLPVVNAANNWWNSADGPQVYYAGGDYQGLPTPPVAAGGKGDNVTYTVRFLPYKSAP